MKNKHTERVSKRGANDIIFIFVNEFRTKKLLTSRLVSIILFLMSKIEFTGGERKDRARQTVKKTLEIDLLFLTLIFMISEKAIGIIAAKLVLLFPFTCHIKRSCLVSHSSG